MVRGGGGGGESTSPLTPHRQMHLTEKLGYEWAPTFQRATCGLVRGDWGGRRRALQALERGCEGGARRGRGGESTSPLTPHRQMHLREKLGYG